MQLIERGQTYRLDPLQRVAFGLMAMLTLVTFIGTNVQALFWQSSDWLVSAVLPAVVVDLTNEQRIDQNKMPLQRNALLDEAAQRKAQHMAENEYFDHYAPDGTTPWSFFKQSGYVYAYAGENLAIHFTDSTEVVEAWMQSPGHRKNIVDDKYTEIGVGTAKGSFNGYDTVYVVQFFGTPAELPDIPAAVPEVKSEQPPAALEIPQPSLAAELTTIQESIEQLANIVGEQEIAVRESQTIQEDQVIQGTNDIETREVSVIETMPEVQVVDDTVFVSSQLATTSGLAVATMIEPQPAHGGTTVAAVATQPNVVLEIVYTILAGFVVLLLVFSLIGEARRMHMVQVAYSVVLLFVMGGLWFLHSLLTNGAVIV